MVSLKLGDMLVSHTTDVSPYTKTASPRPNQGAFSARRSPGGSVGIVRVDRDTVEIAVTASISILCRRQDP